MKDILSQITTVSDVCNLKKEELAPLCESLREVIKETSYERGGHLASALGAVECITALCNVYNFNEDKIIFDVGHQSYAYKILSRGKNNFSTLRSKNGESGFPDNAKGDHFIGGHAGNSLSACIGLATARDIQQQDHNIICFIGDASFFNGENLEAFFACDKKPKNMVIVFNDNGMSISQNENGAYKILAKLSRKKGYKRTKSFLRKLFGNNAIGRLLRKFRAGVKRYFSPVSAMESLGFKYYGCFDGHDLDTLTEVFKEAKERGHCAFIHVKTVKGKGYEPAMEESERYHGISSGYAVSENSFSNEISPILCSLAKKDEKIIAVTAGMKYGTGLVDFSNEFPNRFIDVGICEEYAVTSSAGMALGGLKPIVCVYSTFLQRCFDQVMVDVCMQKAPVVFLIDRAGFVGSDGRTHQGLFDLSYLSLMPNMTVLAPKDTSELTLMLEHALTLNSPVAIRYPNGKNAPIASLTPFSRVGEWETLLEGSKVMMLAVGPRLNGLALKVAKQFNGEVGVINARSVKPLDGEMLKLYSNKILITLEENVLDGGFGESVLAYLVGAKISTEVITFAVKDEFVCHATVDQQLKDYGFTEENFKNIIFARICQ